MRLLWVILLLGVAVAAALLWLVCEGEVQLLMRLPDRPAVLPAVLVLHGSKRPSSPDVTLWSVTLRSFYALTMEGDTPAARLRVLLSIDTLSFRDDPELLRDTLAAADRLQQAIHASGAELDVSIHHSSGLSDAYVHAARACAAGASLPGCRYVVLLEHDWLFNDPGGARISLAALLEAMEQASGKLNVVRWHARRAQCCSGTHDMWPCVVPVDPALSPHAPLVHTSSFSNNPHIARARFIVSLEAEGVIKNITASSFGVEHEISRHCTGKTFGSVEAARQHRQVGSACVRRNDSAPVAPRWDACGIALTGPLGGRGELTHLDGRTFSVPAFRAQWGHLPWLRNATAPWGAESVWRLA